MRILTILTRNARRRPRTRRPDDHVPRPAGFRGAIEHDAARCTGCKTCAFVCSPGAITFDGAEPTSIAWRYFAGQCTFCGRCVEYCPTLAISFSDNPPPVTSDASQHRTVHVVSYQPCSRCGRLVVPLPVPVLVRLYGDPLPEGVSAGRQLCERCRRRLSAERLKKSVAGETRGGSV